MHICIIYIYIYVKLHMCMYVLYAYMYIHVCIESREYTHMYVIIPTCTVHELT